MSWLVICDRCGFKYRSDELKLEWTGLRVCDPCFEQRHPQDFVRGRRDHQEVPWVRPRPDDIELLAFYRHEDGTIIYRENGLPLVRER
jgi:hypothetical protein